jgi:hypothetical protein
MVWVAVCDVRPIEPQDHSEVMFEQSVGVGCACLLRRVRLSRDTYILLRLLTGACQRYDTKRFLYLYVD